MPSESSSTPPAPLPPPPLAFNARGTPPHVDRCPGRRAQPAIAAVLRGTPSDPLLPPALPLPPPPSPSRPPPPALLGDRRGRRRLGRCRGRRPGAASPCAAWPRSNPRSLPGRSRRPRRRRQRCHRLFASRRDDHIRPSRHAIIHDPILRRRTPRRTEIAMITPDSPLPTMATMMPKRGTDRRVH